MRFWVRIKERFRARFPLKFRARFSKGLVSGLGVRIRVRFMGINRRIECRSLNCSNG